MEKVSIFKRFLPIQFLAFGGFLLSFLSFFCNIFVLSPLMSISFIPQPQITIPVVNVISCIICVLVLIFPKTIFFQYAVLIIQSVMTSFMGYVGLSVFLFSLFLIIFSINSSLATKNQKIHFLIFYIVYIFVLCGSIPFGIDHFLVALGITIFSGAAFIFLYKLFMEKVKSEIPLINYKAFISPTIKLPEPGQTVHLKDFDLSERQINILYEIIVKNKSYGQISQKENLSTSLVKKETGLILDYFGCKNINTLKLVFAHFVVAKE